MYPRALYRVRTRIVFLLSEQLPRAISQPPASLPPLLNRDAWDGLWGAVGHKGMQGVYWCAVAGIQRSGAEVC